MRTRAVALDEGRMNVVSERLNWRASACCVASSSPRPSSKTHSGLPVSLASRANTLTMRKAKEGIASVRRRRTCARRQAIEQALVHAAERPVGHDEHLVARAQLARERLDHGAD